MNNMDSFFSGTDDEELIDNADAFPYYLSLVVNNKGKYVAKIAQRITHINHGEEYLTKDDDGNQITVSIKGSKTESTLFISCKVIKEKQSYQLDNWFEERTAEICKQKQYKKSAMQVSTYNGRNSSWLGNYQQDFGYEFVEEDDGLLADVLVEEQDVKTFMFGSFTKESFKRVVEHFVYIIGHHDPSVFLFYMSNMEISDKEILTQVINMLEPYRKDYQEIQKMIHDYEQYKLIACD